MQSIRNERYLYFTLFIFYLYFLFLSRDENFFVEM